MSRYATAAAQAEYARNWTTAAAYYERAAHDGPEHDAPALLTKARQCRFAANVMKSLEDRNHVHR